MSGIWEKLRRVPLGMWAALGTALALLGLYLRGRRLDAELAQAKLHQVAAQARAGVSKHEGRAEVHLERARDYDLRIQEIETARALASSSGAAEEKRLSAMNPDKVHEEYMKILTQKRKAALASDILKQASEPNRSWPGKSGCEGCDD